MLQIYINKAEIACFGNGLPRQSADWLAMTDFFDSLRRPAGRPFLYSMCQREDGLRRPTFPNSWKSGQKSRKKPMVSSLPCALCCVQDYGCMPRVYTILSFSVCKRIVSASVPLPLIPIANNLFDSIVEKMSGSGARRKLIRHTPRYQPCPVNAR